MSPTCPECARSSNASKQNLSVINSIQWEALRELFMDGPVSSGATQQHTQIPEVEVEELFAVDSRKHGTGPLIFQWSPTGKYVASAGTSRVVHVLDCDGNMVEQIVPTSPSQCTQIEWSPNGKLLAVMQENSRVIVVWRSEGKRVENWDIGLKSPTRMRWSDPKHLAVVNGRGQLVVYSEDSNKYVAHDPPLSDPKRKIAQLTFDDQAEHMVCVTEDKQLIIINVKSGKVIDQVKLKSRVSNLSWTSSPSNYEAQNNIHTNRAIGTDEKPHVPNVITANLNGKSLLLYHPETSKDESVELTFQKSYGAISFMEYFGKSNEFLLVGFSKGYFVVVDTENLTNLSQEEIVCAQLHLQDLAALKLSPQQNQLASCGDNVVRVLETESWTEVAVEHISRGAGRVTQLCWAHDGNILSVATDHGCLFHFTVNSSNIEPLGHGIVLCATVALRPISLVSLSTTLIATLLLLAIVLANVANVNLLVVIQTLCGPIVGV